MSTITIDPVCGMDVKESAAFRTEHESTTYLFCSEGCLHKFERNPAKYIDPAADAGDEKPYRGPGEENVRQQGRGRSWRDYIPLMVIVALTLLAACAKQVAYAGGWDWMGWMHDFRDLTFLDTKDGATFKRAVLDPWKTDKCPMSSAALLATPKGIRAAWETNGRIHSSLLGSAGGQTEVASGAVKHPALAINARGDTLAVWTIGTGWAKGGEVAWSMLDSSGRPTAERGKAPGLPAWSHAAAFAEADGGFVIVR